MKTNRNDIYARIHKGLRKALFEFSEQAGKTCPKDTIQITALIEIGNSVFEFLELHATVEEKFQLPYLAAIDPSYVFEDQKEHQRLEQIIEKLKNELQQLSAPENGADNFYQFYLNLNEFIGNYLLHMHHEEATTAEYFIQLCQLTDMDRIVNAINAFTTPEQKVLALNYFMPAISHLERVEFLTEIRKKNYAAFENVLAHAQTILSTQEWESLVQGLGNNPQS